MPVKRSQENRISQFFNVRPGEEGLVRRLFFHNFFQGVGIAFFFTAANTLFLEFFSVKWLPWIYITSALLLFVFGRAYAYFEHHWPLKRLMTVVVGILVVTPLFFYTGMAVWQQAGLIFLLMAFHRVLYTLNSLEFWGLSALAFNVRQSKRIFPLIGAGDIPAKLLGYLAVTAVVPYTGIEALLLIASGSFLISFFFLQRLANRHGETLQHTDATPDFSPGFQQKSYWVPASMFRSPFILWLSLLSVVSLIALTLLDFAFLAEVKYNFKEKESLARFFGLLFSLGYTLILTSKFIISGRVIESLGVVRSTFILPVFLCIASFAAVITGMLTSDQTVLLWMYSAILIGVEIIRYAINDPNLMTLFQPLSRSLRLHGHTLVKTIMNPFGLLLTGAILLGILQLSKKIDLTLISAILLLFSIIMTFLSFKVRTFYLRQLFHAVRTRFFEGTNTHLISEQAIEILKEKLRVGAEGEAIHSIKVLLQQKPKHKEEIIATALAHPGDQVRAHAIYTAIQQKITLDPEQLLKILDGEQSKIVLQAAIEALPTSIPDQLKLLYPFIDSTDEDFRATAISSLLGSGQLEAELKAGSLVINLLQSKSPADQAFGCRLLRKIAKENNYYLVLPLLNSSYPEVRAEAIQTAEYIQHPSIRKELFYIFDGSPNEPYLLQALAAYGDQSLPAIQTRFADKSSNLTRDRQLCALLSAIKTPASLDLLFHQLAHSILEVRSLAARLLHQAQYQLPQSLEKAYNEYVEQWLTEAYHLLYGEENHANHKLLQSAFQQERRSKTEQLLMLVSLKCDRSKFNRIMDSFASAQHQQRDQALEILEYEIPKKLFFLLEYLLDPSLGKARLKQVIKIKPHFEPEKDMIQNVVELHWGNFTRWTTAALLQHIREQDTSVNVSHLLEHPSTLIRQQALVCTDKTPISMHSESSSESVLLQVEKILLLKNTKLFQNIPEHILVDVAEIVTEVECAAGEQLFNKGDMGTKMFIIANGSIRIHDGDHVFSNLHKHDIFGELALLSPEPRSASASASEDSLLLCIDQAPFFELTSTHPEVSKGIIQRLAELLRSQNEEIIEMKRARNSTEKDN